jgi:hypothetical protein
MPSKPLLLLAFFSLLTIFRSCPELLQWEPGGWAAGSPRPAQPVIPTRESDLNTDGLVEQFKLESGRVSITHGGDPVWTSPPDWNVFDAQIADLNRDGRPEVVMALWREFRPWPVDSWLPSGGRIAGFHDAQNRSCHIILWGWGDTRYRELWAGSAMAEPVIAFSASDWNNDGRDELMTVESSYESPAQGRAIALWEWNGFGFTLLGRRNAAVSRSFFLLDTDNVPLVLIGSG